MNFVHTKFRESDGNSFLSTSDILRTKQYEQHVWFQAQKQNVMMKKKRKEKEKEKEICIEIGCL